MVLFPGRYSDLIEAGVHYLPLEKNFTNVDEILAGLDDIQALEAMTERTHQHLVASGRFGFRAYAGFLQTLIERKFDELPLTRGLRSTTWQSSNDGDRDHVFKEEPTDRPFGKERFDLIQCRHKISVLEPEMRRLSKAFEDATAAYLAETIRLTDVCTSEIERLWGGAVPAAASLSAAQSSVEAARNRLIHFAEHCRERHGRFESEWKQLFAPLPRGANTDSTPHSMHRQRLALLESEIKNLGDEIDQLNRHGREAVAASVGLLESITRSSTQSPDPDLLP
jgi:hypothetical protein